MYIYFVHRNLARLLKWWRVPEYPAETSTCPESLAAFSHAPVETLISGQAPWQIYCSGLMYKRMRYTNITTLNVHSFSKLLFL